MSGICKIKGREKGAWYEIKCTADIIRSKESRGESATFERNLLKSWANYKGYEGAKDVLDDLDKCGKSKSRVSKGGKG